MELRTTETTQTQQALGRLTSCGVHQANGNALATYAPFLSARSQAGQRPKITNNSNHRLDNRFGAVIFSRRSA